MGDLRELSIMAEEEREIPEITIVLENANLEIVKAGKGYELLNCDDHTHILKKHKRDPADARPDITHQCLMNILDSPLNKAGHVQVYIHTSKNVLIKANKAIRIPRTFRRFSGLMVQLLHKLSIRATNGPEKLLQVIQNPIAQHLPTNARIFGTSCTAEVVKPREWVEKLPTDRPVVLVFGAMAHGKIDIDYTTDFFSISHYPLSGATALARVMGAF